MRFRFFTPLIESALPKMLLKVKRSSLQFIELFEAFPFQRLFDRFTCRPLAGLRT